MSFLHPDAWYWAAAVALILLLYVGRLGGRQREVAGFWIWQQALARRPVWFRLRFWLSLGAQLLIALLIVGALTQPFWMNTVSVRRNIVLVVDTSASMSATDVAPSRFASALLAGQRVVHSLQLGERMAIVSAGSAVRTACQLTEDRQRLLETISQLTPTGGRARVAEAVAMAQRMLEDQANPRVYVISDGGFDRVADVAQMPDVTLHLVGTTGENLAITRFEARPSAKQVQDYDVLIDIGNFSEARRSGTLRLIRQDQTVWQQTWDLSAGETRQIVQTIAVPQSVRLDARLDGDKAPDDKAPDDKAPDDKAPDDKAPDDKAPDDKAPDDKAPDDKAPDDKAPDDKAPDDKAPDDKASENDDPVNDDPVNDDLALDNFASLLIEAQRVPAVRLVATGDSDTLSAIQNAIACDPRIRLDSPDEAKLAAGSLAPVTILYREIPDNLPDGPLLVIDPEGACDGWDVRDTITGNACLVRSYREDLPLLAGVRIDDVVFEQTRRLSFKDPATTLVEARDGEPLLSLVDRPAGRTLVLHCGLQREQSDLVLRADFPRLLINAVWWLSDATVPYRPGITTDEILPFTPADYDRSFQRPDSTEATLAAGRSFALPDRPGLWRLAGGSNADGGATDAILVASNLVDRGESDLRPPANVASEEFESPVFVEEHPIWMQIVALVVLVLAAEWFLYHRRLIV